MKSLAARVREVKPSATLAVKIEADRLRDTGVDVIDFGPGEPDFPAPEGAKRAAHQAIDDDMSHYLPTQGLLELRRAISAHYRSAYGTDYTDGEVIVSCGGKNALFDTAMALFEAGDQVIIPAPYWVSFPEQVILAGGTPVILPTSESDGFIARAADAERLLTSSTKGIVLCSPSNPTGAVIPQQELDAFAALALERDLYLVFDECYEKFLYDGRPHASLARCAHKVRDRLILISTLSKSYAMTGYRIGYAVADRPLVAALATVQGHDCTHPASITQAAAVAALLGSQDELQRMIREYRSRRDVMVEALRSIGGISCAVPPGAFYAFPNVAALCERAHAADSIELATRLLREARIATVPGEAFGAPGYLRFSYALSLDRIREGLERLRAFAASFP
ncbi:MAG: pyridoxal phosphate-dependent aminotransferase [Candidatus Polarisedimenticolia bacterium]